MTSYWVPSRDGARRRTELCGDDRLIRTFLRVAVAALSLWLLLSRVDVRGVGDALRHVSPVIVVLAAAASFLSNLVVAFRLRALLAAQGVAARVGQTLAINFAAFFYNLFLPAGGVGVAALRLRRLSQQREGRFTAALTAMVCDRFAAFVGLAIVGLVGWGLDPNPKPVAGLVVLLGALTALGVMLAPRAVPAEVRAWVRELHTEGHGTWWGGALRRFADALGSVARLSPAAFAEIIALAVMAQIPSVLCFAILGHGLGLPLSLATMAWVRSVVVLITVLPISIGGIGVREGALVVALQPYGVAPHDALALSILVFATTILSPGLVGGVLEARRWFGGRADRS